MRVKKLNWEASKACGVLYQANTVVGMLNIIKSCGELDYIVVNTRDFTLDKEVDSLEDAFDSAQKYYERRIMSCMEQEA